MNECYTKPLKAAKLKDSISETLFLFLYIYRELSEVSSTAHFIISYLHIFYFIDYAAMLFDKYFNKQN